MRLAYLLLCLPLACGDDTTTSDAGGQDATVDSPSKNDASGDAMGDSSPSDSSPSDSSPSDSSTDSGVDSGACTVQQPDGGACNTMTNTGSSVVPACHGTSAPTAAGGTIADGHYVLTAIDYYDGACSTTTEKIDWQVCGTAWETLQAVGSNPNVRIDALATLGASTVTLNGVCGLTGTAQFGYDATTTTLKLYVKTTTSDGGAATRVDTFQHM